MYSQGLRLDLIEDKYSPIFYRAKAIKGGAPSVKWLGTHLHIDMNLQMDSWRHTLKIGSVVQAAVVLGNMFFKLLNATKRISS